MLAAELESQSAVQTSRQLPRGLHLDTLSQEPPSESI